MAMVTVIIINSKLTTRRNQQLYSRKSGGEVLASGSTTSLVSGRSVTWRADFLQFQRASSGMETHVWDRLRETGWAGLCPKVMAPWDQQA